MDGHLLKGWTLLRKPGPSIHSPKEAVEILEMPARALVHSLVHGFSPQKLIRLFPSPLDVVELMIG